MNQSNAEPASHPVLLVDTDVADAASLAAGLEEAGFPTVCAFTCRDALALASAYIEAVAVAATPEDPKCLDCIRALRRRLPHAWLVVIGAPLQAGARQEFFALGVDALVEEGFSVAGLTRRLAALTRRRRPV